MLSNRISNIKNSIITYNCDDIKKRESEGISFLKLNIGQPDFITDDLYFKSLKMINSKENNGYISPSGFWDLRNSIVKFYNDEKNYYFLENVVITLGASDAIIKCLYSICDKNDKILVLEPFFCDYKLYADMLEIKLIPINYSSVNRKKLEELYDKKVKAIIFSNPNNPDGNILNLNQINNILTFARKKNIYIISDEVYGGFVYDNNYISLKQFNYNKIIIVDSVSKKFNVCGSRIGYILSHNKKLINSIIKLNDIRISLSKTEQYCVNNLFQDGQRIISNYKKNYEERLKIMLSELNKYNIRYFEPKGGISLLVELPVDDTEKFIKWVINNYCLNNESFLITPAKEFYITDIKNKARIMLTIQKNDIHKFVKMLNDSCKQYLKGEFD